MKIKLNNSEMLQLARAIKGGFIDTAKVGFIKSLIEGYNPPKRVGCEETAYYLKHIEKGWGLKLNGNKEFVEKLVEIEAKEKDLYNENKEYINNGGLYNDLVKRAFWGLVAIKALGYKATANGGNFNWLKGDRTPNFVEDI